MEKFWKYLGHDFMKSFVEDYRLKLSCTKCMGTQFFFFFLNTPDTPQSVNFINYNNFLTFNFFLFSYTFGWDSREPEPGKSVRISSENCHLVDLVKNSPP